MMKSPTSLIRFRNAVGVMLALSAIFAVVLSGVTITQDRALGQETEVNVTLSVTTEDTANDFVAPTISEDDTSDNDAYIKVTLSAAPGDDGQGNDYSVTIPLSVSDVSTAEADDYTLPVPFSVTISGSDLEGTVTVRAEDESTDVAEPLETLIVEVGSEITKSLGNPANYVVAGDPVTINFSDEDDNTDATGSVTITIPDGDDADEDPDTPANGLVGQELTADISAIDDPDHDDPATPLDEGTTVSADFPVGFSYHWYRVNGTNDTAASVPTDDPADKLVGTGKTYTPGNGDVGAVLYLIVVWSDKYGNGDATPQYLDTSTTLAATVYNFAKPFIIVGALDEDDERIEPGVVLTRDTSGMSNDAGNLIDDDGNEIIVDVNGPDCDPTDLTCDEATDPSNDDAPVPLAQGAGRKVTFTWSRAYEDEDYQLDPVRNPDDIAAHIVEGLVVEGRRYVVRAIRECATGTGEGASERTGAEGEQFSCIGTTLTLNDDDVGEIIVLVAEYEAQGDGHPDGRLDRNIESEPLGRVYSPNPATGMPSISGVAQVGSTLTADIGSIADADGLPDDEEDITYTWFYGDDEDYSSEIHEGTSYVLAPSDVGETIKVRASFVDALNDPEMRVSGLTTEVTGSPGEISRIEAAIRGVTVSAGDIVTLSVDIYGLQDAKDNTLAATFDWTQKSGENEEDLDGSSREIDYEAPSSPGTYTVTASLTDTQCEPGTTVAEEREAACSASFTIQVRRPSAPVADPVPPVNPPGEIPGLIPDADGNQYEVFTPVEGGTFDGGEGYSINVPSGAVPNGEYIGIRMSDDGAASNLGMTHQRYTLGGNMYGVHAVDASGAAISSYVLEDPAEVCVPLPASLRANISGLSLAAINSDGSLTVLAAQVRLDESGGTMVCGNLSNLPASVAVGAAGAPDAIPTATPVPEPELPPTGGTSPASGSLLWVLLLGAAVVVASGTFIVIGRRQKMVRTK